MRHRGAAAAGLCPLHVQRRVAGAHLADHAVGKAEFAVRACANTQVITKLPIIAVVPARMLRARVGRDFVTLQPGCLRRLADLVQHVVGHVVAGQYRRVGCEIGVGLQRELVDRQMRWREGQRGSQVGLQLVHGLAGQGVHQVEIESGKGLRRFLHGRQRLRAVMHPPQRL